MDGVKVIDPPQYSFAWLVLAVGCVILICALVWGVLRLTRAFVERRAYRHRPSDHEALKAEFLRAINSIGERERSGEIPLRGAFRELETLMRGFVKRAEGVDVSTDSLNVLLGDARTAPVGRLIADLHPSSYSRYVRDDLTDSMRRARSVVRAWS